MPNTPPRPSVVYGNAHHVHAGYGGDLLAGIVQSVTVHRPDGNRTHWLAMPVNADHEIFSTFQSAKFWVGSKHTRAESCKACFPPAGGTYEEREDHRS